MTTITLPEGRGADIAVLQTLEPATVFAKDGWVPIYEAIKKEVSGIVDDITTEEGREAVKSRAYKIARSKTFLDEMGKTLNADLIKQAKVIDNERAALWDKLEALQKEVRRAVTEWEEKEKARVEGHKSAIAQVESLTRFDGIPSICDVENRLTFWKVLKQRDWEENNDLAQELLARAFETLSERKKAAQQAEAERAELETFRKLKAERDAEDLRATEAARQADFEAQAIKRAEEDAAIKIKQADDARIAAEAKAKQDAEDASLAAEAKAQAAVEAERKRVADEEKRIADEAAAREKDTKHKGQIHREILSVLLSIGLTDDQGKRVISAMAKGKLPHVTINY